MSVRAKMCCNHIQPGKVGSVYSFNAVWEGSTDLQKISENAIFGDATPSGSMTLAGSAIADGAFEKDEEYFVDMMNDRDLVIRDDAAESGVKAAFLARLAFRSMPDPNYPEGHTQFRYAIEGVAGGLDLSIKNPAAISWLDEHPLVTVNVKLARGRRSDEEIAIREAHLVERERDCRRWLAQQNAPDVEGKVAELLHGERRQLAIAKGEL